MTSRERVLMAINRAEPDRVPLFEPNLLDTDAPYDRGLMQFLDTFAFDRLHYFIGGAGHPHQMVEAEAGVFTDGYHCRFQRMGVGQPYCTHSPLATAGTVADVEAFAWPDPLAPRIRADARTQAHAARAAGEWATAVSMASIFHRCQYLRGFEQWLVDLKLSPDIHHAITRRVFAVNTTLLMRHLEEVGACTDLVSMADDLGTSLSPYMSLADFRALILPYFQELIGTIKGAYPHIKFHLHAHGQIMDLVPDLIACGVDVLNPVLPLDHMDHACLKAAYGHVLAFSGGVDVEHVLPFGSVDDTRAHVREVLDVLAPGGGFMLKLQDISPMIPAENVMAAYECAWEYGRYRVANDRRTGR